MNNVVQSPIQNLNITPSISHGRKCTPKHIQVDESAFSSMEGKMPQCTIRRHYLEIIRQYFEPKYDVGKCHLFLCLRKSRSFLIGRRILGIKTLKNIESSSHIVKSLVRAFMSIGKKYRSKDCNIACHVLAKSIVNRRIRQCRLSKCTSEIVNLNPKTLKTYSIRRDSLDIEGQMEKLWAFSGRLPCKYMKLVEAMKGLVQSFWNDNTRPSSNTRDVLKHCKGYRSHEPHIKHYLHMAQTQFYEMFKASHPELRLSQRTFEKCKPWYVRINAICNTCFCRYNVEFEYYYNSFVHIRRFLHPNHVQECSSITPPISSKDFLHTIMCMRRDNQAYYAKQCLDGTCNICGGKSLWS